MLGVLVAVVAAIVAAVSFLGPPVDCDVDPSSCVVVHLPLAPNGMLALAAMFAGLAVLRLTEPWWKS